MLGAFRGWAYEDFAAGTTSPITLSANENGTYGAFDSDCIVDGTAVIVRSADPATKAYTGTTKVFSTKVEVSNHTGTAVTLSGNPHANWGEVRVYYLYDYKYGMPADYEVPSRHVSGSLLSELDAILVTEDEVAPNTTANLMLYGNGTKWIETANLTWDESTLSVTGTVSATAFSGITTAHISDIDTGSADGQILWWDQSGSQKWTKSSIITLNDAGSQFNVTGTINVGTLSLSSGSISDTGGTISFINEHLTTTGDVSCHTLKILDSDNSNNIIIQASENISSDIALSLAMTASRLITLNGSPTLDDWFDQSVKTGASVTFNSITDGTGTLTGGNLTGTTVNSLTLGVVATNNIYIGDADTLNVGSHTSSSCVAIGVDAAYSNTDCDNSIFLGTGAGYYATTSDHCLFIGTQAGRGDPTNKGSGNSNVALGTYALYDYTTGNNNMAIGYSSLQNCTTGYRNTGVGSSTMYTLTIANQTTAIGFNALYFLNNASYNTAVGCYAGYNVTSGKNTLIGENSLYTATSTEGSVCVGYKAGYSITTGDHNIIIGFQSADATLTTGSRNIIIGKDLDASAADVNDELNIGDVLYGDLSANSNITINATTVSANYDLGLCGDGVLMLKETATPTADTNYGKVYCKNDNKLYFQDGAGTEHEIAFV